MPVSPDRPTKMAVVKERKKESAAIVTHIGKVIDEDDFFEEVSRRSIHYGVNCA